VTELIPPAVANAGQEKLNPNALPMGDFRLFGIKGVGEV
jgi:uncharacterized oxidoreductase